MMKLVKRMMLSLPIVRVLREHKEDRSRSDAAAEEALQQQHEIARRVHVLEWMAYPRPDRRRGVRQ